MPCRAQSCLSAPQASPAACPASALEPLCTAMTDLEHIPPLPPDTTYLYARFNRIGAIRAGDFMGLSMLEQGKGQALGQLCKDG